MLLKKMIMRGVVLTALIAGSGLTAIKAYDYNTPSPDDVAFAKRTSDLLHNEVFAALLQEFSETTPENIEEGKQAISLIFNNANRDIRLVGVFSPLLGGFNNLPSDSFERRSMALALQGQDNISPAERVGDRWYYRRSVALNSGIHPSCVMCHTNFAPNQWVGALMTRVPIKDN